MTFRTLVKDLFKMLVLVGDSAVMKLSGPAPRSQIRKVLIVRVDVIGDFVLWLDAAKELRKIYPQDRYRITLLGNSAWTEVAKTLPYWDEVLDVDRVRFERNPLYRWKVLRRIQRTGFDVAIQPTYFREGYSGDAIVRLSGALQRIGSAGGYDNINKRFKKLSDRWYTKLVPAAVQPMTALERNAEFMRGMGLEKFRAGLPELSLGNKALKSFSSLPTSFYILCPGAGSPMRRWPTKRFAELAKRIYSEKGYKGLICGSHEDRVLGDKLASFVPDVPLDNVAGRTTLSEFCALVAQADLLIGNESSGIHLAAASGTPSVCIQGGGHYGLFVPYRFETQEGAVSFPKVVTHNMKCFGCNWRCRYLLKKGNPAPCISKISTETVWAEVHNLIDVKSPIILDQ